MRAFYVVLAALAFLCETNTVSALSQNKLPNLVESDEAKPTEYTQCNNPRRLRRYDEEEEEDDGLNDEERTLERMVSLLAKFDETKLDDLLKNSKYTDEIVDMKKLERLASMKDLNKQLQTKSIAELLKSLSGKGGTVYPNEFNVVANLLKMDSDGMATHLSTKMFPDFKARSVEPVNVVKAMREHGGFDGKFIDDFAKFYGAFRKKVDIKP